MNTSYFISDLHLGHKNILKYSAKERPFDNIEDHDEFIIEKINETVNKNDTLYFLGDIAFGKENLFKIGKINVKNKVLILGNHDHYSMLDYISAGFNKIYGVVKYKEFILSHVPVHTCQLEKRFSANIHGHLHTYDVGDPSKYFNCNVDRMGFIPISLQTIRDTIKYNSEEK